MGRPKLKEEKKKVSLSISISRNAYDLASQTHNHSHFIQTSIESAGALALVQRGLREGTLSKEDALEEIEDINDIWLAEFDDEVLFSPSRIAKKRLL